MSPAAWWRDFISAWRRRRRRRSRWRSIMRRLPKAPWLAARGVERGWPVAGLPDVDSCRQRPRIPRRGRCSAGRPRIRHRADPSARGDAALWRPYRALDRHDDGRCPYAAGHDVQRYRPIAAIMTPERHAVMTLDELERWLALEIVGRYHATVHSSSVRPAERGLASRRSPTASGAAAAAA